jgi:hypothetical protein
MNTYRERLWPAPWLYLATSLVIPASLLVFVPINVGVGAIVAVVLYAGCCGGLILAAPVIEVTPDEFIAGRARLPRTAVGAASAHSGADAVLERGQRLDARAWLLIRGWIAPVVKVEVLDPEDPTPYWLVSTRRPNDLVDALQKR